MQDKLEKKLNSKEVQTYLDGIKFYAQRELINLTASEDLKDFLHNYFSSVNGQILEFVKSEKGLLFKRPFWKRFLEPVKYKRIIVNELPDKIDLSSPLVVDLQEPTGFVTHSFFTLNDSFAKLDGSLFVRNKDLELIYSPLAKVYNKGIELYTD